MHELSTHWMLIIISILLGIIVGMYLTFKIGTVMLKWIVDFFKKILNL